MWHLILSLIIKNKFYFVRDIKSETIIIKNIFLRSRLKNDEHWEMIYKSVKNRKIDVSEFICIFVTYNKANCKI